MTTLTLRVSPSQFLAERNYGVRFRGTIYVSPTLYDLFAGATDREMELLLEVVRVVDLDNPDVLKQWKEHFKKQKGLEVDFEFFGQCLAQ